MSTIRILDDRLVSQIAAGEVVERPASVVKELIENALDAGAQTVEIELEGGGRRRIRVSDDGSGMDGDDVLLAFDRHATSKIESFEDLQRVATLGFRGEALSSIAAVAGVELASAMEPGPGHLVRVEGGSIRGVEPTARPRGTTVDVSSLFFNVPARRKFLKSASTELRRCTEVVQGYALARPEVGFRLGHEGRLLLEVAPAAAGMAGARRRIGDLFGRSLADHLVELAPLEGAGESVGGFVGDRSTVRGRRYFTFVNRRLLRDRALMATYYRAVRQEWRSEEFPALFLFLDVPAEQVDVNVHPQKSEVRFRDAGLLDRLAASFADALRRALGEAPAPLRRPGVPPRVPFVWQGLGGAGVSGDRAASHPQGGELREGASSGRPLEPAELAEVVYAPSAPRMVPLSGRSAEPRRYRLLGQYKGSLILLEGPTALYLIDQHAAHERILYERLRRATMREAVAPQGFVEPVVLELGPAESMRLGELRDELEECGFDLSELSGQGGGGGAPPPPPAMLTPGEAEGLLLRLVGDPVGGEDEREPEGLRGRLLHALSASLSCRAAIKIHRPLTAGEMAALVEELFAAEQPFTCPHGRPVVLEMSDADLERRLGRR